MRIRVCRACGCTEERACVTAEGPCHWLDDRDDLCSACVAAAAHVVKMTIEDGLSFARCRCGWHAVYHPAHWVARDNHIRLHWLGVVLDAGPQPVTFGFEPAAPAN